MHLFEHAQRLHYFNNHLNSCPCRGQRQVRGKKEALHAPGDWVCCQQSWPKWKSCFHFGILLFSYVWFIVTWCLSSHTPMYHRTHEGKNKKSLSKKNLPKYAHFSYSTHIRREGKLGKWSADIRFGYIFVSRCSYYSLDHCNMNWKNSTDPLWKQHRSLWLSAGLVLTESSLVISHYSCVAFVMF